VTAEVTENLAQNNRQSLLDYKLLLWDESRNVKDGVEVIKAELGTIKNTVKFEFYMKSKVLQNYLDLLGESFDASAH
jgi:hypothetical protein